MSNRVQRSAGDPPVEEQAGETRRTFVKKAAYVAPVILTLSTTAAFAHSGSGYSGSNEWKEWKEELKEEYKEYKEKNEENYNLGSVIKYLKNLFD